MIDIKSLIIELDNIKNNSKLVICKLNIKNPKDEEYDRYVDLVSIITNQFFKEPILLLTPLKFNDRLDKYWDLINKEKEINNEFNEIDTLQNHTIQGYIDFLNKNLINKGINNISIYYNNSENLSVLYKYDKVKGFKVWNDDDKSITLFFY